MDTTESTIEPDQRFTIHAVSVDIVMNKFGLHVPDGAMYVLDEHMEEVKQASGQQPDDAYAAIEADNQKDPSLIQPLVIRANEGDTVEITFKNHLDRHASIHQTALPYDVTESDGMSVGRNPDTTAPPDPDEPVTYRWEATHQGTHFFYDGANQAYDSAREPPQQSNLLARGLFGAIVVEPEGAEWLDPQTLEPELRSGVRAVIDDPTEFDTHYREFVVFYHSPVGVKPDITWPATDKKQSQHAINYRCDPTGQRVNDDCEDCRSEKYFYHSWTNGDPGGGDNAYTAYKGDPIKFCFVGASHEENHVHHLHQHRTKEMPRKDAATVDAQTIGLGDTYDAYLVAGHGAGTVRPDMEFDEAFRSSGAGYVHGTAGDILFHCHLFPHYAEGMWGTMRVLDKEQGFLEPLPETAVINDPDDLPLDSGKIIAEDDDTPGFPAFIGEAIKEIEDVDDPRGHAAPKPPELVLERSRDAVAAERAALGDEILPGAPYTDPVEGNPNRIVTYTITVTQTEIAYNDAGEFDPDGVAYVAKSVNIEPGPGRSKDDVRGVTDGAETIHDAERVRTGKMNPEPLFLRANVGDEVRVRLENDLDTVEAGGQIEEWDASIHPHYVGYDVLASDSLPNGFNYYQASSPDEPIESRWYADEEGTIYFHDHIFAIKEGVHGMFCGLIVEPEGSEWYDPYSGDRVFSGAQANIVPPDQQAFREQALHYHDFAPLRHPGGEFVNPEEEHIVNKGTMALNYRNAPYYNRDGSRDGVAEDAAYVHSSAVHGDPPTPVLEAYDGDPIRFRVFQGAYEEQHTFSVHGLRTRRDPDLVEESVSKYLGTSEAFTFEITAEDTEREGYEITNPDGLPVRDYLYGSNIVDDLWAGMWGLVRLWGAAVEHLQPLGDSQGPGESLPESELREMGHPAPHSGIDWTKEGQRAKHLYEVGETALTTDDPSPLNDQVRLPGSTSRESVEHNRRRHGTYRTVIIPPDVGARRNHAINEAPPTPEADGIPPARSDDEHDEIREYEATAIETEIPYNEYGDSDPHGVVFALDQYVDEVAAGTRTPEPLCLRVNEGERLRLTLTNRIPTDTDNDHPHPEMLIQREWERSNRVSLHPLELRYDVNRSDGAAVGFNYDTTVGPGETRTYEWYAEEHTEISTVCMWDMADLRSTRHHGAFGQVMVEPPDSIPLTPETAEPAIGGLSAMIRTAESEKDFREYGLVFADAQYVLDDRIPGDCVVPRPDANGDSGSEGEPSPCTQVPHDTEDQGYGGVNYRSEPFDRRFERTPEQHLVFDSTVHGDPATPVVGAIADDLVRFRVACAGDKARGITFHLAGHPWKRFRDERSSPVVGVNGQFGPGTAMTVVPDGAGGAGGYAGDYIYQETKQRRRLESGMWGLFRVHGDAETAVSAPVAPVQPLPDAETDLELEDRNEYYVESDVDFTGNGTLDTVVGVPGSDLSAVDAGAVYVFLDMCPDEVTHLASADLMILGDEAGDQIGRDVETRERPDGGVGLVVGTASGSVTVSLEEALDRVSERSEEPGSAASSVSTFVDRGMPVGEWPVVDLRLVARVDSTN